MDHSVVATQITLASISVAALQWLKSTKFFPWATQETARFNRILAVIVSGVAALGVHFTWQSGPETGTYIVTITGATIGGVAAMAWVWIKQFVMQELVYRTTANSSTSALPAPVAGGIGQKG